MHLYQNILSGKRKVVAGRNVRVHAVGPEGEKEQVHCSLNFVVKQLTKKKVQGKELCQVRYILVYTMEITLRRWCLRKFI